MKHCGTNGITLPSPPIKQEEAAACLIYVMGRNFSQIVYVISNSRLKKCCIVSSQQLPAALLLKILNNNTDCYQIIA